MLQPTLVGEVMSIFACIDLAGDQYLLNNLHMQCWQGSHLLFTVLVGLPFMMIYVVGTRYPRMDEHFFTEACDTARRD
jgi:hypothetical protein